VGWRVWIVLHRNLGDLTGRSAKDAAEAITQHAKTGKTEVYDADLSGYFDTIPHDKLISAIRMRVVDGGVLGLIRQWLRATIVEPDGKRNNPGGKGTPQGGVISPLLSNVYLHWFEVLAAREARRTGLEMEIVRYARVRMTIHLKRRSQRKCRTADGKSFYEELGDLGLVYLK